MTCRSVPYITGVPDTGTSGAFHTAPAFGDSPKLFLEDPGETKVYFACKESSRHLSTVSLNYIIS